MKGVGHFFVSLFEMFRFGDWKTRLSFLLFGFGNLTHKQIGRGLLLVPLRGRLHRLYGSFWREIHFQIRKLSAPW
jgi:hypothetical protein